MNKLSLIKEFVACPACHSGLYPKNGFIECPLCGKKYVFYDNDIVSTLSKAEEDVKFSMDKWDEYYHDENFQKEAERVYVESTLPVVLRQLFEYISENRGETKTFLEIGCGQALLGEEMAKRGWLFIGIDYSLHVLASVKKRLENHSIDNYILIHGDITSLPVRSDSIDFIYGGGVIEHFKDSQPAVNHLFRVLKEDGVLFNSVPFVNIGNMVYRSMWGSIPNLPVIRQIAEFVHIKLLKGEHMRFGYELQYTASQLKKIYLLAGFKNENITIDRFDYTITLEFVKNKLLRRFFAHLIKTNRQFWQMVKVIGIK